MNKPTPRLLLSGALLLCAFVGTTPVFAQGISEYGAAVATPKGNLNPGQQSKMINGLYGSAGKATAGIDAAIDNAMNGKPPGGAPHGNSSPSPQFSFPPGSTKHAPGAAIRSGDIPGQSAAAARAQLLGYGKDAQVFYQKGMDALSKGKLTEAEANLRKSLTIRETYWKDKDKVSPVIMVKLAEIYMTKNENKKAEVMLTTNLASLSRIYGPGSDHRLKPLCMLSEVYKREGDKLKSYDSSRQAYFLSKRSHDESVHPATLMIATGKMAIELNKFREAEEIYESALADDQRSKLTQEELLTAIDDYAIALKKMNRERDAEFVLVQAQQIREQAGQPAAPVATPEKTSEAVKTEAVKTETTK